MVLQASKNQTALLRQMNIDQTIGLRQNRPSGLVPEGALLINSANAC